ncbi:MAG: PAS domain-containing protein [Alphaproteobacteria bacterium]|nr:PAS domain-containing protein [Alphaproteobacteria bacterium]MBO4644688.1 PAS domain-containing protein [Alphaproteobacteria bacterium]
MTHSFFRKLAGFLGLGSFAKDWDTVQALMDSETDAMALISPENRPVYINAAGKSFFKTFPLLQSVLDRVLDDEANRLALAKLEAAVKNKAETSVELLMLPLSGNPDFWEWYSISIKQLSVGTLWRVRDITAERALDAVMRKETQDLAEFLDVLPIGLYQINSGGVIHFVNQRFCDWLGYTNTQELKGKKLVDLLVGHQPELDGFWHGELTFRTQAGTFFTAFVSHAVYDENGETMLRASVVRDVMSRRERSESNKDAEVGFSRLFAEAPVGIAFLDKENIITEANSTLFQMFSRQREEMIGTSLEECIDPDDWAELKDKMAKIMMAKLSRIHEEIRLKTEQEKFAAIYITPMTEEDEDGETDVFGFIAHFIDNTERRNLALQFSQAQKMQAIGQLAGGIAHDFNNLLTAIIGSTDLLLQTHPASDPDFTELMNVHYSATRAASLVGQLLSYSRKQPLRPKYLDVTDVFAELLHMLKRLLGTKIAVQIENGRNLGFIRVDKTQFDQMFVNLAVNARDAMPDGGTFTISTRSQKFPAGQYVGSEEVVPGEYVVIDVADTGCGISEENLQRIFEPFFTTKSGSVDSGTGLGLAMVYGNISKSGGYISVKSTVNVGTTFSLYLPRHSPEEVRRLTEEAEQNVLPADYNAQAVSQVVRVKPNAPKTGDQLQFSFAQDQPSLPPPLLPSNDLSGSGTILLVEDEDGVRAVTRKALSAKGYTIEDCTCAEEALEKIENGVTFDLLITDMVMPGMNGVTLASTVRQKGIYGKILLISGFSEEAARGEIKEMPDFYFLAKPFTLRELCEKVKEIMGKK